MKKLKMDKVLIEARAKLEKSRDEEMVLRK